MPPMDKVYNHVDGLGQGQGNFGAWCLTEGKILPFDADNPQNRRQIAQIARQFDGPGQAENMARERRQIWWNRVMSSIDKVKMASGPARRHGIDDDDALPALP